MREEDAVDAEDDAGVALDDDDVLGRFIGEEEAELCPSMSFGNSNRESVMDVDANVESSDRTSEMSSASKSA